MTSGQLLPFQPPVGRGQAPRARRPSLLIGHPDEAKARVLGRSLRGRYEVLGVMSRGLDLLRSLVRRRPDLLLVFDGVQNVRGFEVVREAAVLSPGTLSVMVGADPREQQIDSLMAAGVARVEFGPQDPAAIAATLEQALAAERAGKPGAPGRDPTGKVWAFLSAEPGDGAAAIQSVARKLAAGGRRPVLVDLAYPFGELPRWFEARTRRPDLLDLLAAPSSRALSVERFVTTGPDGIALVVPPTSRHLPTAAEPAGVLAALPSLRSTGDFIFLELPAGDPRAWGALLQEVECVVCVGREGGWPGRKLEELSRLVGASGIHPDRHLRVVLGAASADKPRLSSIERLAAVSEDLVAALLGEGSAPPLAEAA